MDVDNKKIILNRTFNKDENEESKEILNIVGSNIDFNSNTWFCDKKLKSSAHRKSTATIYFNSVEKQYLETMKYFALWKLHSRTSPNRISNKIKCINIFYTFIKEENIELCKINQYVVDKFKLYLDGKIEYKTTYKNEIWSSLNDLIKFLYSSERIKLSKNLFKKNPYERPKKHAYKYIPKDVIRKLDYIFRNENIPRYIKLAYWIGRMIPARSTEIAGMSLDCIKPYGEDMWVIMIPTWKQNGGYKQAQIRRIYVKYEGQGKFLVDLIKEYKDYATSLQQDLSDDKKGFLFTYKPMVFDGNHYKVTKEYRYKPYGKKSYILNRDTLLNQFNNICNRFKIKDTEGNLYYFSQHQLRHNGITDRLHSGFTESEIMLLTDHKNTEMIVKTYNHHNKEELVKSQKKVHEAIKNDKQENNTSKPVLFNGRIMNMDEKREQYLLKNFRAYKIKDLGICSDFVGCKSGLFQCLDDCDYFVPDANSLDYFKEQVEVWRKKVDRFKNFLNAKENAEYNLKIFEKIVKRIENVTKEGTNI